MVDLSSPRIEVQPRVAEGGLGEKRIVPHGMSGRRKTEQLQLARGVEASTKEVHSGPVERDCCWS